MHECSDPLAAMTTLCLLAGASGGKLSGVKLILLILEPARQRHLGELKRAVERYVPGVVCRAYREQEPTQIGPLEPGEEMAATADPPPAPAPSPPPMPQPMPAPAPDVVAAQEERTAEDSAAYAAHRAGPPQLRLAGLDDIAGEPHSDPEPGFEMEPRGESEPLTAEELAMLLADDEDEAQER